jgi:hypothetical protein
MVRFRVGAGRNVPRPVHFGELEGDGANDYTLQRRFTFAGLRHTFLNQDKSYHADPERLDPITETLRNVFPIIGTNQEFVLRLVQRFSNTVVICIGLPISVGIKI